jgi:hypothetical protein
MGDGLDAAKLRSRRLYEEVFDQFGEDDRVVCRWTATGTHTGPLTLPSGPVAPTGRRISFEEIRIDRHADARSPSHGSCRTASRSGLSSACSPDPDGQDIPVVGAEDQARC